MSKKSNRTILSIIISIVAILAVVGAVWLIVRGDNSEPSEDSAISSSVDSEQSFPRVTPDELAKENITDTVAFGDYDAMFALSKAIQNGEKVDAIVEVEGLVNHKFSSYSVVQESAKKAEEEEMSHVGTVFIIEDGEPADYPEDEQRIKITAKVVEVSPLNFQLVTLKNFIEVVE